MTQPAQHPYGLPAHAVQRLQEVFRRCPGIERVVVYGSRAKGNYRHGSDIDLCVEAPSLGVSELLRLEAEIDDLLLPWKVDLSLRHTIENDDLLAHIDRVGVPLYSAASRER